MSPNSLGARLREARLVTGKSREQVAVEIDRSFAAVQTYESGKVTPPLVVLARLAQVYGVRISDLVDDLAVSSV